MEELKQINTIHIGRKCPKGTVEIILIILILFLILIFVIVSHKETGTKLNIWKDEEVGIISFLIRPGCKIIWKTIDENQIDSTTLKVKINYEIYCPNENVRRNK